MAISFLLEASKIPLVLDKLFTKLFLNGEGEWELYLPTNIGSCILLLEKLSLNSTLEILSLPIFNNLLLYTGVDEKIQKLKEENQELKTYINDRSQDMTQDKNTPDEVEENKEKEKEKEKPKKEKEGKSKGGKKK